LGPFDDGTPLLVSAVSQKQINEVLIRHAQFGRHFLEVAYCTGIKANRDLPLELLGVGVFTGLRKIVFFSHLSFQYTSSSNAVARLAEINRITESDCR
jgi:hypothetical protein